VSALELRFASDRLEAVFLPDLGARLHRLRVFGQDLLRTPGQLDAYRREPFFWGSFVMAPWCNRIPPQPADVGSRTIDLAPNFPDGTAIHGQVQARPWEIVSPGALRVQGGGDGWPWRYEVTLAIDVGAATLRMRHGLTNRSDEPMPAGIGIHPWFRRPLAVAFPAQRVYPSNIDSAGEPMPVAGAFDLRRQRDMPPDLDATWTDLRGPHVAELSWPNLGIAATMRATPDVPYLCAASPTGLDAVAIEPQTHAPDGLRRLLAHERGGLSLLPPGEALELIVELAFRRDAGSVGDDDVHDRVHDPEDD
jgi:aldose 1-epimerase